MKTQKILGIINPLLLVIVPLLVYSCTQQSKQEEKPPPVQKTEAPKEVNPYLEQYAGTYEINVKGYSGTNTEMYILSKSGNATWKALVGSYSSTKQGTWTASEGKIKITIKSNSGDIKLTYTLKDNYFVEDLIPDRYLVKQ